MARPWPVFENYCKTPLTQSESRSPTNDLGKMIRPTKPWSKRSGRGITLSWNSKNAMTGSGWFAVTMALA